jgi:hypothetical protein
MGTIIQDSIGISNNAITIPRGKRGLSPITIDISKVQSIESRIPELARSTPITMPELVTQFTIGIAEMARLIALVQIELNDAERALDESRSISLLERAEDVLRSKGIKSSADYDVKEARETYDILKAILSFLHGKRDAIEMAYHGTKKVCDVYLKTPMSNIGVMGD